MLNTSNSLVDTANNSAPNNTYTTDEDLFAGYVSISEELPDNWYQQFAYCDNRSDLIYNIGTSFVAENGKQYDCYFNNQEYSEVTVTKFNDYNEDGVWDEDEPALPDWDIVLTPLYGCLSETENISAIQTLRIFGQKECLAPGSAIKTTDVSGLAVFEEVLPGGYSVDEVLQPGWTQSVIYCDGEDDYIESEIGYGNFLFAYPGETTNCYIGNFRNPIVQIDKSNNATGPVNRGSQITFTIVVQVPGLSSSGILRGTTDGTNYLPVTVTDFLQDEFEYVPGSFAAVSSERGDITLAGITTDPNYASPGSWALTNSASNTVVPGEIVTLTYKAVVGQTVAAGTYPTTASVTGYGSDITVTVTDSDNDQVTVSVPAVLGVSTELAVTGQSQYTAIFGGILLVGTTLILRNRTKQEMNSK